MARFKVYQERTPQQVDGGKLERWSLAAHGLNVFSIQWHFIDSQIEQKLCKKWSLSEPLRGFLCGANMLRGGRGGPRSCRSER